ncbi:MAG: RNA polymerase sigma factor [Candidatus Sulfotelmatobacter sp.]
MKSFTATNAALMDGVPSAIPNETTLDRARLEQSFESIIAANGPALSRLAASYTNTLSDRDDLLQEIAFAIWQALPRFREECSERTFAFRVAHNRAITHLSRSKAQPHESIEEEAIEVADPGPGPESNLAQRQTADRLRHAVHRLPVAYRQVILLTLEGLGYREISDVLGISESNVGVRLNRARQLLQDLLKKDLLEKK